MSGTTTMINYFSSSTGNFLCRKRLH